MAINQHITENLFPEAPPGVPFFLRRVTVWGMLGMAVLLTVLLYFTTLATMDKQFADLYDRSVGDGGIRRDLFLFLALGIPVLGFLISLPASLLPYNKSGYRQKYVPFAMVAILGIQFFLMAVRLIDLLILTNKK
ncbi:hypothetical protein LL912_12960 [Niabella sp. CC-SYL272]|uniref:hypothetical protein n=1 Tax=Niabella agricola TaxID=2891571 RepID=UPI001F2AD349|nr:hypothetical protein [Niabella agricola]MCF3109683.1 hypothetical protein [Niabella agricola]